MKNKEIFNKVLKLLSKKDYSEKEIIEKIPSITPSILNKLKKEKLIDDFSLSKRIVESLKNKGKGYHYILKELERRKIDAKVIEEFKNNYDFYEELERCKNVINKLKNRKKQSIILNLKSRGFPEEVIEKLLKEE